MKGTLVQINFCQISVISFALQEGSRQQGSFVAGLRDFPDRMLNHRLGIVKAVNCVTARILNERCPAKNQNLLGLLVYCQSSVPPRTRPKAILADAVPRPRWDIENHQIVKTSLLWV